MSKRRGKVVTTKLSVADTIRMQLEYMDKRRDDMPLDIRILYDHYRKEHPLTKKAKS